MEIHERGPGVVDVRELGQEEAVLVGQTGRDVDVALPPGDAVLEDAPDAPDASSGPDVVLVVPVERGGQGVPDDAVLVEYPPAVVGELVHEKFACRGESEGQWRGRSQVV